LCRAALREPRFKSGEDAPMQFNVASFLEVALRLWLCPISCHLCWVTHAWAEQAEKFFDGLSAS
jgi:hypothetical protein